MSSTRLYEFPELWLLVRIRQFQLRPLNEAVWTSRTQGIYAAEANFLLYEQ